jgi:hypothetical protein
MVETMRTVTETQQVIWRPSFPDTPRTLRVIPVSGADAVEWTMVAIPCVAGSQYELFAKGAGLGMSFIKSELLLPIGRNVPLPDLMSCFATATATANRRAAKLSRILHLVHAHPGVPPLHKGLRFVTASLWASYAELGLEGEEGKLQSARIISTAHVVWTALGWKAE